MSSFSMSFANMSYRPIESHHRKKSRGMSVALRPDLGCSICLLRGFHVGYSLCVVCLETPTLSRLGCFRSGLELLDQLRVASVFSGHALSVECVVQPEQQS